MVVVMDKTVYYPLIEVHLRDEQAIGKRGMLSYRSRYNEDIARFLKATPTPNDFVVLINIGKVSSQWKGQEWIDLMSLTEAQSSLLLFAVLFEEEYILIGSRPRTFTRREAWPHRPVTFRALIDKGYLVVDEDRRFRVTDAGINILNGTGFE